MSHFEMTWLHNKRLAILGVIIKSLHILPQSIMGGQKGRKKLKFQTSVSILVQLTSLTIELYVF